MEMKKEKELRDTHSSLFQDSCCLATDKASKLFYLTAESGLERYTVQHSFRVHDSRTQHITLLLCDTSIYGTL